MCDMAHVYIVTALGVHNSAKSLCERELLVCETWLWHICDMTHIYIITALGVLQQLKIYVRVSQLLMCVT